MEENEFEEFILVDVGWLGNRMKEKHIPSMTQISIVGTYMTIDALLNVYRTTKEVLLKWKLV